MALDSGPDIPCPGATRATHGARPAGRPRRSGAAPGVQRRQRKRCLRHRV